MFYMRYGLTEELFWNEVKARLKSMGKNQEWLCDKTGILLGTLRNRISQSRYPTMEEAIRIAELLDMSFDDFGEIALKGSKDGNAVPVFDEAFSAGRGQFIPDLADVKEYVECPKDLVSIHEHIIAAHVRGDSMYPTLHDDDMIYFDTLGFDNLDGVYTIFYNGNGYVKRLMKTPTGIKVISDNPVYPPFEVSFKSEELQIIGKVRYVLHKLV